MEAASLYQGLTFLAWTSVVFLIVVGIFIVKLLFDCTKLVKTVDKTATIINDSAKPIIEDVTETVNIISKMVKKTETKVNSLKGLSEKTSKIIFKIFSKTTSIAGIISKGVWSLIKTFIKK